MAVRTDVGTSDGQRRRYDSPVRRQQMEATRQRILAAGAEIVRELDTWDWSDVTFAAVARRADVATRTVFRHFPTERDLHAGVMTRLAEEVGVDYSRVTLQTLTTTMARVFRSLGTFAVARRPKAAPNPAMTGADLERRHALLRAVEADRPGLSAKEKVRLAATLDVLWSVYSYERLVAAWDLSPKDATAALERVIQLVLAAELPEG